MPEPKITFEPYAPGTTDSEGQRISSIDPRLSRTNYFDGRLLKASDLIRDQVYLDERALEIGQVLGSGIVRGLEVELDEHYRLRVGPGLAIAPSGRVLQLADRTLEVNLGNSALIASLNQGYYRRFRRGLYLVALQYAEVGSDSAEAYPADLASPRRFHYNSFAEGVELVLVPLAVPFSNTGEIAVRIGLQGEFMGRMGQRPELSDEAVALGLLALEQGRPLWLDRGLVRRPLRQPGAPDALQQDLAAHYEELLDAVLAQRLAAGLTQGFAAVDYFHLLPPWGSLPKSCVDPVTGSQTFFPEGYEVSIAPVRRDDLPAILQESARLAPMDLRQDRDADVMLLVPMDNSEFAWRARALERGSAMPKDAFGIGRLLHIDRLALRLRPQPKPYARDTDKDVWQAIWEATGADELLFVRRPPRTAETNVSAVVLARGFDLPKPGIDLSACNRVLELELKAARAEAEEASADLAALREDYARRLRRLKLDKDAPARELTERVKALESERDALAERVKTLQAGGSVDGLAAAKQEITRLSAHLESAKQRIEALETAGSTAASTELEILLEKNRLLGEKLKAAHEQIEALKAAADAGTAAGNELAETRTKLDKLALELDVAHKRITELQTAGDGGAELAAAQAKLDTLTKALEAANKQITELQAGAASAAELTAAQAKLDTLTKAQEAASKQIGELKAALEQAANDVDTHKAQVVKLTGELGLAQNKIAELQAGSGATPVGGLTLADLAKLRPPTDASGKKALDKLAGTLAGREAEVAGVGQILMLLDRRYDRLIWPTLLGVAQQDGGLARLRDHLLHAAHRPAGQVVAEAGAELGLTAALIDKWKSQN